MNRRASSAFTLRQYMLSRDFELYYYSDRDLKSVDMHRHDYVECYFFLEGQVEMRIGDVVARPVPGDVLIVPPGTDHCLQVLDDQQPYRRFVFWVTESYLDFLKDFSQTDPHRQDPQGHSNSPDRQDQISDYFLRTVRATSRYLLHFPSGPFLQLTDRLFALLDEIHADRFGKELALSVRLMDIILTLNRCTYELLEETIPPPDTSHYDAISRYIQDHLGEDLSLDKLSATFYLSKYSIIHLFRDLIGMSPHQYITKQRISRCADAIRAGEPISAVCLSFGFKDYSGFYRAFMKEYGESPRDYQTAHMLSSDPQDEQKTRSDPVTDPQDVQSES